MGGFYLQLPCQKIAFLQLKKINQKKTICVSQGKGKEKKYIKENQSKKDYMCK
jgi:hypothetical protein